MHWQTFKFWAGIAIIIIGIGLPVFFVGRWLEIDVRFAFLGALISVYVVMSITVGYMRRRLGSHLKKMSATERESLIASSRDARHANPKIQGPSVQVILWVGLICINGALLPLFVGPLFIYQVIFEGESGIVVGGEFNIVACLMLLLGFVIAWSWWSVGVTVWRVWAAKRSVDKDELQYLGENAFLLWPIGHFFEKTELGHIVQRWRRK